jgi:isocitrate/isopropylmalate dehydrogenase
MYMVTKPKVYDVIVTTNMFGDIITDLGAAIQGGMGHGRQRQPQPDAASRQHVRAGPRQRARHRRQGLRQPIATFLSVAMMLDFLGKADAAKVDLPRLPGGGGRPEETTRGI